MRVLSYCWFHDPKTSNRPRGMYARFAPAVFRAARVIYPDFDLVVHHDANLDAEEYGPAMRRLHEAKVLRLVDCGEAKGISRASLWRLKPIWEGADIVLCRDLDSIPSVRERWAVEQWLRSGKAAHAINDHQGHVSPHWPEGGLMTGTCGFRGPSVRRVVQQWQDILTWAFKHGYGLDAYGHDEAVLNLMFQPLLKDQIFGTLAGPKGRADIQPTQMTVSLPSKVIAAPSAFTEYIGMCIREPEQATAHYSDLPNSEIFEQVFA